jgi:hypothetical protein
MRSMGWVVAVNGFYLTKVLSDQGFISSGFHLECLSILLTAKSNMAKNTKHATSRTS